MHCHGYVEIEQQKELPVILLELCKDSLQGLLDEAEDNKMPIPETLAVKYMA